LLSLTRIAQAAAFAVILVGVAPLPHAAADTCAQDNYTEAGTCAPVMPDPPMTPFQAEQQAGKDAALAAMRQRSARTKVGGRISTTIPDPGDPMPSSYQLVEVHDMRIFKEGEGNGKKSYTCGPSATRNMVAAMYMRKTGALRDFGEAQFEDWEGTTTSGTSRANIANALNAHFSSFGHWTTSRPATASEFYNIVKSDTYTYHQSVITNVDTEYLPFFAGHALDHFDFVYGYYLDGNEHDLRFGEEWDPVYIYGSSSYNPYGHHPASLADAFTAISHTPIHGIVS